MKHLLLFLLLALASLVHAEFTAIPSGWRLTLTGGAQGTAQTDESGIRLTKSSQDGTLLYHGNVPGVTITPGKTYRAAFRYQGEDGSIMVRVDGAKRTPYPTAQGAQGEAELFFTAKPGENAVHFHFVLNKPGETILTGVLLEEYVQSDNLLTHRERRWRLAFANDGQGELQSGKNGVQIVKKTSSTGNVVFVGNPDLPIEPGHHYLITATAKRDTNALSFALMVQMPGGKRTPFPTVSAKQPAGKSETIEYLFTAKEDEKLVRPHLLLGGQGTLVITSITVKEMTVAEADAFREARKVRETHFTGDELKKKWFPYGKLTDSPNEDGAYTLVVGQMGGIGCSNLAWQADAIKAVEVDFLMEDSSGYLSLDFKSLFPDGSEHSSFKGISALPGVRQTLMFPVGNDPAWKGTITDVRLVWHGQTARLSFASLTALPYINSLYDFRPRGRYRLSRISGQGAAALSLLDRNGKTLQTVNLPSGDASVDFTAHEQAMEISAKCDDSATRLNLTRLELVNPTRPTPYWRGEWIWSQNGFGPDAENVWLTRDFTLDQVPCEASFVGVGDDLFECFINGVNIGGSHDWQHAHSVDVLKHLRQGRNTITARVYNVQAWGGFLAELYVNLGGQPIYIVTDKEWRCHVGGKTMPETFEKPVMVLGPPPVAPWNSRVNYAYVGPKGKIQVLQKGTDCFRAKVLRKPSVDLDRMELSLQSPDGKTRRAFAAITPSTALWQEGQEVTVNLRLSPQAEASTAFCACDSLEVADNAPLASISATPRTTAKLAQCHIEGAGTRPQIVIDGKPHAPIYYLLSGGFAVSPESKEWMFQAAAKTGCNILRLGARFEDLWRSENEFDFSSLDRKLDAIELTAPNAYLILNIQTGMPEWWCQKYPDDVTAYYGDHPRHRQKDRQALASKRYLQDADKGITTIIAHLKQSFLASRFIGVAISEGWNSEWFWSYADDLGRYAMAGYSPSDHATFRSYLREAYGTDEALAKAWNMPGVTIATAPMPPPDRIKIGSVGLLLNPEQDMQVIDWFRFRNRSLGEAITYLCGVVKRETNGAWLAGAYYGYLVAFSNIFGRLQTVGHLDIERVARSPNVDFLTAPSYYTWRHSGESDGIMQAAESFTAHGKLIVVEQDLRTYNETSNHEIHNGMLSTPDQSVGAIQRAVALPLTRGVGTHWLEMYENWFYEPLLQEVMGEAKRAYEALPPVQGHTPVEVTILSDTQSAFYTKHNVGDGLHVSSIGEMQRRFAEAAIPFRHVLLRDALETGRIPPARFYIVNNLLTLSPEDRAALMKRFQDEHATVLWLYAAGLNLPNRGPDTKLMGELLGVTFQMDNTVRQPKLTLEPDLGAATALNFNRSAPWFLPISGFQQTLGKDEQGRPALVKWTKDGVTHIFSTLMNLPPQVIRALAMQAGVHSYSGTGDPVLVGNDVVALHAKGSHQASIHLPKGCAMRAILGPVQGTFQSDEQFSVRSGQTYVFQVFGTADNGNHR